MQRRFRGQDVRTILRVLSTRDARRFLTGLPVRALLPLGGAVFCMFSIMGFIIDIMAGGTHPPALLTSNVIFSGAIGVAYGYTSLRGIRAGIIAGTVHVLYVLLVPVVFGSVGAGPASMARLRLDGTAIIIAMALSYTFFLRFIGTTGLQYLNVRAEIRLASEIHAVLVPAIETTAGEYEIFGVSRASGEVGGDLVDIVRPAQGHGWIGYVADVSGHGVSSGVLMGMTKSATRMRLRQEASLADLLNALNEVLHTLSRPSMFVTFAGVRHMGDGALEFTIAGHLPLLRVSRGGEVVELTTPQIPIGMFEDFTFTSARLTCAPGELLALVTDGLTEVFDASDADYGLERLKGYLRTHAQEPLDVIADGLLRDVAAHGPQLDDQSLLLIRRRPVFGTRYSVFGQQDSGEPATISARSPEPEYRVPSADQRLTS